jgi:hypothetical protein
MQAKNVNLDRQLRKTETTISTLVDELVTQSQRFLNNTVEILDTAIGKDDDPISIALELAEAVECPIDKADISNIYVRAEAQRKGQPKSKLVVTFVHRTFITIVGHIDFHHQ